MKIPALVKFIILVIAAYGIFKAPSLFGKPVPESLLILYIFFAVVVILLVMTATEEGTRELAAPLSALVIDPSKKTLRNIVFVALPLIAAIVTYRSVKAGLEAPVELRSVHPAPPAVIRAYGRTFNLQGLENPFRALETEDPGRFEELVREGGIIYFEECFYCHGAKLDGRGHFSRGLNPPPLPFKGTDTIAQLRESYLFWRIVKGGEGLPRESAPWSSTMPAWEDTLSEDEVWKTILFLYDYTGNRPLRWD
ncbi:MAG TPA: cytochrome c [Thermodesulfobacteriota bacterium]|nr:cytochrome c [Thermodesulfobacteriota bacterium]